MRTRMALPSGQDTSFDTPAKLCKLDQAAESTGAIVVFSSGGKIYDTNDLKRFDTTDAQIPVAYFDPDSSRVFIEKRDRWKSDIIEIEVEELRELSQRVNL